MSRHVPETTGIEPLVEPLWPTPSAVSVFRKLAGQRHCVFFDSALYHPQLGRYSFVAADPFETLRVPADGSDALTRIERHLGQWRASTVGGLPPFQGGAAGLFGYDLAHSLENLPRPRWNEFAVPAACVGFYDVVVAFDHRDRRAWIVSQGFPEVDPDPRHRRAMDRIQQVKRWLEQPNVTGGSTRITPLRSRQLSPQFDVDRLPGLTSGFSPAAYRETVGRAIDYIRAGDIFQVNLSQRLLYPARDDPVSLYLRLRHRNPATFAAYMNLGDFQIVSASPERFLSIRDHMVEARPIKGTRQRTDMPEADLYAASELKQSEKDRAENVMIVDLLRNDISRVCDPNTVQVNQLCGVETYQYVQHLVSSVRGRLQDGAGPIDLIRAAFPGGSITGAPKIRAMEIIAELEPTARGAYCGSLGYIGYDGATDLSILIRTITAGRGWWQLPVGGGVVAQSVPELEYQETWHKAEGLIRALV